MSLGVDAYVESAAIFRKYHSDFKIIGCLLRIICIGHEGISVGQSLVGTVIDNNFLAYAARALFGAYLVSDEIKTSVEQPDEIILDEL